MVSRDVVLLRFLRPLEVMVDQGSESRRSEAKPTSPLKKLDMVDGFGTGYGNGVDVLTDLETDERFVVRVERVKLSGRCL
ncbi:hypothetical protein BH23ACT4_BH23ACT4_06390 [soil metagenome]